MRKILLALALVGLFAGVALFALAQAAPDTCIIKTDSGMPDDCPAAGTTCLYNEYYLNGAADPSGEPSPDNISGATCCFMNTISSATNWLFLIMMMIVVILIMLGGFTIITAGGDAESIGKGRNYIVYAMMGIVIGVLARAIPYIMRSIIGF